MSRRRRRSKRHRILPFFAVVLSALLVWSVWGNTALTRTDIVYRSPQVPASLDGMVIAQISDLHDAQIGTDNHDITAMLRDIRPDLIVLTGDMVDSNRVELDRSLSLIGQLTQIAPVYYANGNHEAALSYNAYRSFTRAMADLGVTVLEDKSEVLTYRSAPFQLIGLNDLGFISGGLSTKIQTLQGSLTLLTRDDLFTLVLAHRPELIDTYAACGPQLVLCGHAHGGQLRLPLIGGLYSPGQGFLPKYDAGLYTKGATSIVVSRGIGNSNFPLRFNNRPEIVVITLRSALSN